MGVARDREAVGTFNSTAFADELMSGFRRRRMITSGAEIGPPLLLQALR
jgi:hypothetical protein